MARNPIRLGLCLALALGGCGGGDAEQAAADSVLAAGRARRDSMMQAQARADSIARATFAACQDSVVTALKATAAGRRKLARALPEGMIRPDVLQACGTPPADPAMPAATDTATSAPATATPPPAPAASAPTADPDAVEQARLAALQQDQARQDETQVMRETFSYGGGRRDPFVSLLNSDRSGPELSELALVGIYLDLGRPSNSVAVLRDKTSGKPYKVKPGDQIGRARVLQIRQTDVVFMIEDFGFERQETKSLPKREEMTP